ncbi:MAG TPA: DUF881 domain-containing protein [Micromonosporaceae bacterium]
MEYTSGMSSWPDAVRRAIRGLVPRRRPERWRGWSLGVPVIALAAGILFTTTATTAGGTSLRDDRRPELAQLIEERRAQVDAANTQYAALRAQVEAQSDALAGSDRPIAAEVARAGTYRVEAGYTTAHGPGVTVRLNDAPRRADGSRPAGVVNDDLLVHQQDVQAVVNALWAGGAEAMSIMDVRVISTSAVRCVGNTLLLHGRVYSPPFTITAIGDPASMQRALAASAGVRLFRDAAAAYGLGYHEVVEGDVTVPAYDGGTALRYASVPK